MSRRPARCTEADLKRAVAAARLAGPDVAVEISPAGDIDLVSAEAPRISWLKAAPKEIVEMVYFVRAPINGFIKIGFTTDIEGRLAALRAHCAVELELLGVVYGDIGYERHLHHIFHAHRRHGEWFASSPELLAFIAEKAEKP